MSDEAPRRGPVLPPIAYPVLGLVFGGILVYSFSRVLLAVKKDWAPAIGLLMALNVLVGAALVAYGSRVRRRPASFPLLVAAAAGVIGIGVLALNLNEQPVAKAQGGGPGAVSVALSAQNIAFSKKELTFPAGAKVTLSFDNKDSGVPHNFALFSDQAATQAIFRGEVITGPKTTTYSFTVPPSPGTLYFHCDIHPTQMTGTVTVTAGGGGGGGAGGGGGGGPPTITAKNISFHPTELTVTGGGQVTVHFDNQDSVTHNMVFFNGPDATAPVLYRGDPVSGPATKDYTFTAPPPGTYFFHCEFHPQQMTGKLVVK